MKVINTERYLTKVKEQLVKMQEMDLDDINLQELARICFHLGKMAEWQDYSYTTRGLIELCLKEVE